MNALRTVETASSVWKFDVIAGTYTRRPRVEGADHPNVPYTDEARVYALVRQVEGNRLAVVHPDGTVLVTGAVLVDSLKVEVPA